MMNKAVFWDFDGTLAHRNGYFSEVLLEVLNRNDPGSGIRVEDIRRELKGRFPWHRPEVSHFELNEPEQWWSNLEIVFEEAYLNLGCTQKRSIQYAKEAHYRYIDPEGFCLFDDTLNVLDYFYKNGWKNIILSNHVPELKFIADELGIGEYLHDCISSAAVGFEKPNPAIYRLAIETAGYPEALWMVGDNLQADYEGALNAGIKAVLVRNPHESRDVVYSPDLNGVIGIIES